MKIKLINMFAVSAKFIGIFKIGDNIHYNLSVLEQLYKARGKVNHDEQRLFNKPITILLVSIIEALLYDFHFRVQRHYVEGVKNLADAVINYIRGKQIDEFEALIASSKIHKLFGDEENFYNLLDNLRKLRNRIHIQNKKHYLEADEFDVFTDKRLIMAEQALERVMKRLSSKHPRGKYFHYVEDFILPWDEHSK